MNTAERKAKGWTPPHPSTYGDPSFVRLEVTDEFITAYLSDGRAMSVPTWWSPKLLDATPEQRAAVEIIGGGVLAEWEELDEHVSVGSFFHGSPAPGARKPEVA